MTRQITLNISEQTHKQAEHLAALKRRLVADVLADHLSETFPIDDEVIFLQSDPDPSVEQERDAFLTLHSTRFGS